MDGVGIAMNRDAGCMQIDSPDPGNKTQEALNWGSRESQPNSANPFDSRSFGAVPADDGAATGLVYDSYR